MEETAPGVTELEMEMIEAYINENELNEGVVLRQNGYWFFREYGSAEAFVIGAVKAKGATRVS